MKHSDPLPLGRLRSRQPSRALVLLAVSAFATHAVAGVAIRDNSEARVSAQAQPDGFGRLDPTPPTGVTPEEIITKMGAQETAFALARQNYTYRQTVKVQTIEEDSNRVDGEYQDVEDITFDSDGKRQEHVVFAPQNTLQRVMMSESDLDDIRRRLPFVLTTAELPQYDVEYLGKQKVDELETYVFSAGPKKMEKGKRYFQGKVWVDQQDFEIVLVNGKNVPDVVKKNGGNEDLSPPFTTYYEQIDGKYWFPTYTKAEGTLHFSGGNGYMAQSVHMRNTVRYTDYKRFGVKSRIIGMGDEVPDSKTKTKPASPPH